jgi:hypothetical protein
MSEPNLSIMRIIGRIDGEPTPYDNRYVLTYDASGAGGPELEVTDNPALALRLPAAEMWDLWKSVDRNHPVRPWDGKPNRPLTAYTIQVLPLANAGVAS